MKCVKGQYILTTAMERQTGNVMGYHIEAGTILVSQSVGIVYIFEVKHSYDKTPKRFESVPGSVICLRKTAEDWAVVKSGFMDFDLYFVRFPTESEINLYDKHSKL